MDRQTSAVRIPLHPDVSLLAQCRRRLLCQTHQKASQARRVPIPPRTQRRHPPLPRRRQRKPKALYLDQGPQQNHRSRQTRAPSVRFDPLATKPIATGSPPEPKTMGIVVVAALAANVAWVDKGVAITATWSRTRSAAISGRRSLWSSAQRYSILTFWPSTSPVSLKPLRNAATKAASGWGDPAWRNPITGSADCCARAASGHAIEAPPRSAMNSRRLIRSPRRRAVGLRS